MSSSSNKQTPVLKPPKTIYNVELERKLITEHNLLLLTKEIEQFEKRTTIVPIKTLVNRIRLGLEQSLFGCSIDVGIFTDPKGRVVDFYGDRSYIRKVYRGESSCFTALDKGEIVVESDILKNITVFVPLVGPTASHGVLEIHGLIPESIGQSEEQYFRRQVDILRTMITNKDYTFKAKVRFWKKVAVAKTAGIPQKSSFMTVSGRVKDVVHNKNGIPFFGGPRFNIVWEDGSKDQEININDLLKTFRETAHSLGNYTVLDVSVHSMLSGLGSLVGRFLESRKVQLFLKELREKIDTQQVNIIGMVEMSLQSFPLVLSGIREIALVGYQPDNRDLKSLVQYSLHHGVSSKPKSAGVGSNKGSQNNESQQLDMSYTALDLASEVIEHSESSTSVVCHSDSQRSAWMGMELVAPNDFRWGKAVECSRFVVVLHRVQSAMDLSSTTKETTSTSNELVTPFDRQIIEGVVLEIEQTIKRIWRIEKRRKNFRDFIRSLEGKLFEWRNASASEMCFNLLTYIPPDLLKAHMYVGMVQSGGDELHYITANVGSRMEGRRLIRGDGVSFDVVDSSQSLVFAARDMDKRGKLVRGAVVDIFYGRKKYRGAITRSRGHDCYDVRYDFDRKIEAGVDISRIIPMNIAFRAKLHEKAKLPFVCVAVRHHSKVLGVLGVDHIDASSLVETDVVDTDFKTFLEQLGKLLGAAIDVRQKKALIQSLYVVSKNVHADISDIVRALFDSIVRCSPFINGTVFAEIPRFVLYPEADLNATSLVPATNTSSKFAQFSNFISGKYSTPLSKSTKQITSSSKTKSSSAKSQLVIIGKKGLLSAEVEKKVTSFNYAKFGKRSVQRIGRNSVWLFSTVSVEAENRVFCTILHYKTSIADIDFEFFETLQKTITAVLQTILSQKASGEFRYEALTQIKELCHNHYVLNRRRNFNIFKSHRTAFFNQIADIVLSCYHSTNMYVGILGKFAAEINFVLASLRSQMVGKRLFRSENKGVSFDAIDKMGNICVTAGSSLSSRLRHFADRNNFEYPFIVIPLIAGIDSIIGVLNADNCAGDQMADSEEQLVEVLSFFTSVSIYLGNIVQQYRVTDVNEHVTHLSSRLSGFQEGFPLLKQLVLSYMPSATRVIELTYCPRIQYFPDHASKLRNNNVISPKLWKPTAQTEIVLLLCVKALRLFDEATFSQNTTDRPKLKIMVQGKTQQEIIFPDPQSSKKSERSLLVNPLRITFPKDINMHNIKVQFAFSVRKDNLDKEICSFFLSLHYFLHASLNLQEHYFDNLMATPMYVGQTGPNAKPTQASDHRIRIGSMALCSKLFVQQQVVGFQLESLSASVDFVAGYEDKMSQTQIFSVIKWNGQYLGHTVHEQVSHVVDWPRLQAFLPLNSYKELEQNSLLFEFYCKVNAVPSSASAAAAPASNSSTPASSKDLYLGQHLIDGERLATFFSSSLNSNTALHVDLHAIGCECPKWIESLQFVIEGVVVPIRHQLVNNSALLQLLHLEDDAAVALQLEQDETNHKRVCSLIRKEPEKQIDNLSEQFIRCELTIYQLRDLFVSPNIVKIFASRKVTPRVFVSVIFNGDELGTTSYAIDHNEPLWKAEHFRIMLPLNGATENGWKDQFEGSQLVLDVFAMEEETNEQFKLGTVTIEGLELGRLFLSKSVFKNWFDVEVVCQSLTLAADGVKYIAPCVIETSATDQQSNDQSQLKRIIGTQILLSGKAIADDADSADAKEEQQQKRELEAKKESEYIPEEKGMLQFAICRLTNVSMLLGASDRAVGQLSVTVDFNGLQLSETKLIDIDRLVDNTANWTQRTARGMEIPLELIVFRFPWSKTLFQSALTLTIWQHWQGVRSKLTEYQYSEGSLVKLLSQKGVITRWISLATNTKYGQLQRCDLEIQAGPAGTNRVHEYDDFALWLDLACVSQLSLTFKPPSRDNYRMDQRPNVFLSIFWNDRLAGTSPIEEHFSNIVFDKQRFILRVPLYFEESQRLQRCKLRVEVRHRGQLETRLKQHRPSNTSLQPRAQADVQESVLLGSITLTGDELVQFFGSRGEATMKWFKLRQPEDEKSITLQMSQGRTGQRAPAIDVIRDEHISLIKLRGCVALTVDDMLAAREDLLAGHDQPRDGNAEVGKKDKKKARTDNTDGYTDYVLHVLALNDLANVDAFGGANAYVEVIWMDETIGFTQIVPDTLDQEFSHEQFILRWNRHDKYQTPHLQFLVWSLSPGKPKTFLGQVILAGKDIQQLLTTVENLGTSSEQRKKLAEDPDMTSEENENVQGQLSFEVELIDYDEVIQGSQMVVESVLFIQSALRLPCLDALKTLPSIYFTISRMYLRESEDFVEIYKSQVSESNANPIFPAEFCPVLIPNTPDWTGFQLLLELFNVVDQTKIGHVILAGDRLKRILSETNPVFVRELREFPIEMLVQDDAIGRDVEQPMMYFGGGTRVSFASVERAITIEQSKLIVNQSMHKVSDERAAELIRHRQTMLDNEKNANEDENDILSEKELLAERTRRTSIIVPHMNKQINERVRLQITLQTMKLKATNTTVSGSNFDGYLELRWNHKVDETMRTAVSKMSFSTTGTVILFDCERFEVEKLEGIHISTCTLECILYQKFQFKDPIPLGQLLLVGDDIITLMQRTAAQSLATHWKVAVAQSVIGFGHPEATISLNIDVVANDESSLLFNTRLKTEKTDKLFCDIQLTIISAMNLSKTSLLMGSTNPYAVITYNHKVLGETSIIEDCLNPVWPDNQTFVFRFPKKFDAMVRMITSMAGTQHSVPTSRDGVNTGSRARRKRRQQQQLFRAADEAEDDQVLALDGIYSVEHLTIHIDFFSKESANTNIFLGSVDLPGDILQQHLSANPRFGQDQQWFPLIKTSRLKSSEQKYAAGSVQLWITRVTSLNELNIPVSSLPARSAHDKHRVSTVATLEEDQKEIDVLVLAAKNLPTFDRNIKQSNAIECYVRLRWNGFIVGTTYVDKANPNLTWENEKFTLRFPANTMLTDCVLNVELWQSKSTHGHNNNDMFLGGCEIAGEPLEEMVHVEKPPTGSKAHSPVHRATAHSKWIKLFKCAYLPDAVQHAALQMPTTTTNKVFMDNTAIQLDCHFADHIAMQKMATRKFEVKVFEAEDLKGISSSFSSMGVFVIIKWNNREIGRTYSVTEASSPVWKNQHFSLIMGQQHNYADSVLSFEVWSQNRLVKNDFIGLIELTDVELCSFLEHKNIKKGVRRRYALRGRIDSRHPQLIEIFGVLDVGLKSLDDFRKDATGTGMDDHMTVEKLEDSLQINWLSHLDRGIERPFLEFTVLSAQIQFVQDNSHVHGLGTSTEGGSFFNSSISGSSTNSAQAGIKGFMSRVQIPLGIDGSTTNSNAANSNTSSTNKKQESEVKEIPCMPSCVLTWNGDEVQHLPAVTLSSDGTASWETDLHNAQDSNKSNDGSMNIAQHSAYLLLPQSSGLLQLCSLLIDVWDDSHVDDEQGFLGGILLPFDELLRLYCGRFTFNLLNNTGHSSNPLVWNASITFALKFVFPFWDSSISLLPKKFHRKISVLGAANLPLVNGEMPNTKCVLSINGVVVLRSMLIVAQCHPRFPRVTKDVLLDIDQPLVITIEIYHLNMKTRKEVLLGSEELPFEYLLRPPKDAIDLFLGPPKDALAHKRQQDSDNQFALSGSIRVQVEGSNRVAEESMSFMVPSHRFFTMDSLQTRLLTSVEEEDSKSVGYLNCEDVCWSGLMLERQSETLAKNLHLPDWLTSPVSLYSSQEVIATPQWLLLPVMDIGISIGKPQSTLASSESQSIMNSSIDAADGIALTTHSLENFMSNSVDSEDNNQQFDVEADPLLTGTVPGRRLVLAIERSTDTPLAVSDKALLEQIMLTLTSTVTKLRWKDINKQMRDIATECIRQYIRQLQVDINADLTATEEKLNIKGSVSRVLVPSERERNQTTRSTREALEKILNFVRRCLELLFPGCNIRFVSLAEDAETLYYECFQSPFAVESIKDDFVIGSNNAVNATAESSTVKKTIPSSIGNDVMYFGKQFYKSQSIHGFQDMFRELPPGMDKQPLLLFHPFAQSFTSLPRFNVPLVSEDCSYGLIQLENFHYFDGGMALTFNDNTTVADIIDTDENGMESLASETSLSLNSLGSIEDTPGLNRDVQCKDIRHWLDGIGEQCGSFIYAQLESRVLSVIRSYMIHHTSHRMGLFAVIVEEMLAALQGCLLTEVLSIEMMEYKMQSVLAKSPLSSFKTVSLLYSHRLCIDDIRITIHRSRHAGMAPTISSGKSNRMMDKLGGKFKRMFASANNSTVRSTNFQESSYWGDPNYGSSTALIEVEDEDKMMSEDGGSVRIDQPVFLKSKMSATSDTAPTKSFAMRKMILSVKYDEFEQILPLKYDSSTDMLQLEPNQDITLHLKPNFLTISATTNPITLSIYEVDDNMIPLNESTGFVFAVASLIQSLNAKQTNAMYTNDSASALGDLSTVVTSSKSSLIPKSANHHIHYDVGFRITVDHGNGAGDKKRAGTDMSGASAKTTRFVSLPKAPPIRGYKLNIVRAANLKPMKNNAPPSVFCEVVYNKKSVHSTKVVKSSVMPEFKEAIYVPVRVGDDKNRKQKNESNDNGSSASSQFGHSTQLPLMIDVFDMSFLTKGNFFGRVEIPFEALVATIGQEPIVKEYPLKLNDSMNVKKQSLVGGSLFLSVTADIGDDAGSKPSVNSLQSMPSSTSLSGMSFKRQIDHWHRVRQMNHPRIKLTIDSANDLMAANRFGGASDPFAMIYFAYPHEGKQNQQMQVIQSQKSPVVKSKKADESPADLDDEEEMVAKTEVKAETLNPIWNELFDLSLLSHSMRNKLATSDVAARRSQLLEMEELPNIRIEIFDFNQFTASTFLGECELTPQDYLHHNEISMSLRSKKTIAFAESADKDNNANQQTATTATTTTKKKSKLPNMQFLNNLTNATTKPITGQINLHWEFFDDKTSFSQTMTRDAKLKSVIWNGHGGLAELDLIDLHILRVENLHRESGIAGLAVSVNAFVIVKEYRPPDQHIDTLHEGDHEEDNEHDKDHHPHGRPSIVSKGDDEKKESPVKQQKNSATDSEDILAKTRKKKGSLSPVFNEHFSLNMTRKCRTYYSDLLIELWHRDDFFGTQEFLGETILRAEEYLHPVDEEICLPFQPNVEKNVSHASEALAAKEQQQIEANEDPSAIVSVLGTIFLRCRHHKHRQSVALVKYNHELYHRYAHSTGLELSKDDDYMSHGEATGLAGRMHKDNPLSSQRKAITMIYDPVAEKKRQLYEGSDLPQLLDKTNKQLNRYMSNPFARTGLISELHYGQLCAAARRADKTCLRMDRADMLCIPLYTKPKVKQPLLPASESKDAQVNQNDDDSSELGLRTRNLKAAKPAVASTNPTATYLVCRYAANRISKRDMRMLDIVQAEALKLIETIGHREERRQSLCTLLANISATAGLLGLITLPKDHVGESGGSAKKRRETNANTAQAIGRGLVSPTDVLIHTMLDFEVSMQCSARCYLLNDDASCFLPMSMETGKPIPLQLNNSSQAAAQHAFIQDLACLLRHDIVVQYYQQRLSICRCSWSKLPFSQVDLPSSDDLLDQLSHFLSSADVRKYKKLFKTMKDSYPDGCFAMPIFAHHEVMIGLLVMKNINRNPFALYEYFDDDIVKIARRASTRHSAIHANANPTLPLLATAGLAAVTSPISSAASTARRPINALHDDSMTSNDRSSLGDHDDEDLLAAVKEQIGDDMDYDDVAAPVEVEDAQREHQKKRRVVTIRGLEHGITQTLLKSTIMFSDVILAARLQNVYRSIRSFPFKEETSPLIFIRYAFRMLVTAVPAIREISLWALHLNTASQLISTSHTQDKRMAAIHKKEEAASARRSDSPVEKPQSSPAVVPKQGNLLKRMLSFTNASNSSDSGGSSSRNLNLTAVSSKMSSIFSSFRSSKDSADSKSAVGLKPPHGPSMHGGKSSVRKSTHASFHDRLADKDTRIVQGVFGDESPNLLLQAPLERKIASTGQAFTPASQRRPVQLEEERLAERKADDAAGWKVLLPTGFSKHDGPPTMHSMRGHVSREKHAKRTLQSYSLDVAHREIVRCVEHLRKTTMTLHSGHCLSMLCPTAEDIAVKELLLSTIFNPVYLVATTHRRTLNLANSKQAADLASQKSAAAQAALASISGIANSTAIRARAPVPSGPPPDSARMIPVGPTAQQRPQSPEEASVTVRRGNVLSLANPQAVGMSEANNSLKSDWRRKRSNNGRALPRPSPTEDSAKSGRTVRLPISTPSPMVTSPLMSPNAMDSRTTKRNAIVLNAPDAAHLEMIFLTVRTHGIGGDDGWGYIGPHVEKAVESVAQLINAGLLKLTKIRTDGNRKKEASASNPTSPIEDVGNESVVSEDMDEDLLSSNASSSSGSDSGSMTDENSNENATLEDESTIEDEDKNEFGSSSTED